MQGFPDEAVELALLRTRGQSVAAAAIWLTEQTPEQLQSQQAELLQAGNSLCLVLIGAALSHTCLVSLILTGHLTQLQASDQQQSSYAGPQPMASEPVLGYPSSAPQQMFVHPNGQQTSAVLLGVHSECKMVLIVSTVSRSSAYPLMLPHAAQAACQISGMQSAEPQHGHGEGRSAVRTRLLGAVQGHLQRALSVATSLGGMPWPLALLTQPSTKGPPAKQATRPFYCCTRP